MPVPRPVHRKLAAYLGEPIEASVLIHGPPLRAGRCHAHGRVRARGDGTSRRPQGGAAERVIDAGAGKPIAFNCLGFLRVYDKGVSLQRPIAIDEWGEQPVSASASHLMHRRLTAAMARLMLSAEELARRESMLRQTALQPALLEPVLAGKLGDVKAWLDRGAELGATDAAGQKRSLLQPGAGVNSPQSRPMIVVAALGDDLPMLDVLLRRGARPDLIGDDDRRTALSFVVDKLREAPPSNKPAAQAIIRRLVAGGADIDRVDGLCRTAYTVAAEWCNEALQKLLLELGAHADAHLACERGRPKR